MLDLAYSFYPPADEYASQHPPLLVVHGLFGHRRNWQAIAKRMAQLRPVWALDLRNHGDSPWVDAMDYPAMADDIAGFITQHQLGKVDLLGHSMGGKAAMALALRHPELLRRLIIADIAPGKSPGRLGDYAERMLAIDLTPVKRRSDVEATLSPHISDASIRAFLATNLELADDGQFHWKPHLAQLIRSMPDIMDFPADLLQAPPFEGPTQFIAGGLSPYITPADYPIMRRLFPNYRLDIIDGAGHWLHAEKPREFIDLAQQFLA